MLYQFYVTLILLCSTSVAAEQDRVFRSANAIRDGNLYADAVHVDFAEEKSPSEVIAMLRHCKIY